MFKDRVIEIVKRIPRGKLMTYKNIARLAGSERAFRAVGNIMSKNYDPKIPCHRVIKSDGSLGNYNRGGSKKKKQILIEEGINFNHLKNHIL